MTGASAREASVEVCRRLRDREAESVDEEGVERESKEYEDWKGMRCLWSAMVARVEEGCEDKI